MERGEWEEITKKMKTKKWESIKYKKRRMKRLHTNSVYWNMK